MGVRTGSFDPTRFRSVFYLAAVWNLSAAAGALLFPQYHAELFFGSPLAVATPAAVLNSQIVWVSVAFFGVGYWMVAREPTRNHGLILVATLGKIYVGLRWIWAFGQGIVTPFAVVGAAGDLMFASIFAIFLLKAKRSSN